MTHKEDMNKTCYWDPVSGVITFVLKRKLPREAERQLLLRAWMELL